MPALNVPLLTELLRQKRHGAIDSEFDPESARQN